MQGSNLYMYMHALAPEVGRQQTRCWAQKSVLPYKDKESKRVPAEGRCLYRVPIFLRHQLLSHNLCWADGNVVVHSLCSWRHHICYKPEQTTHVLLLQTNAAAAVWHLQKHLAIDIPGKACQQEKTVVRMRPVNSVNLMGKKSREDLAGTLATRAFDEGGIANLSFFFRPSGNLLPQYSRSPAL